MTDFYVNQIVRGHKAGVFVILGFFTMNGIVRVQLKAVDPDNYSRTAPGELSLPINAIRNIK